jgi:hypothetical protein
MVLRLTQPLTEMRTRNSSGVKQGRYVRLTTLLPSMNRFCRKCGIPDVSQTHRFPQPIREKVLLLLILLEIYLHYLQVNTLIMMMK